MAQRPLVSVVVATYNMAQYVGDAVRSVLAQTNPDLEIVIVDDGSTDATPSAIDALKFDARVRYHVQQNRGQAAAKNHGIRESKGEFIAFLDADDLWEPDKLEVQLPLFASASRTGVVYSRLTYIDEHGRPLRVSDNELFRGRVSAPLLIRNFIGFGTTIVRRECFERMGMFREGLRMGIDYDLWLRFSTQYEFDFVDRPLLRYRMWSGQMSNDCERRYLNGIEIMRRFLDEFPGIVDARTQSEAWAHTYVGLGECLQQLGARRRSVLSHYARALRFKPGYLPAWRAMLFGLVR